MKDCVCGDRRRGMTPLLVSSWSGCKRERKGWLERLCAFCKHTHANTYIHTTQPHTRTHTLTQAAASGRLEACQYLLQHVRPPVLDNQGRTPLHQGWYECECGVYEYVMEMTYSDIFFSACINGHTHLIEFFLENAWDINAQDNKVHSLCLYCCVVSLSE